MTDESVSFTGSQAWSHTSTEFLQALKAKEDRAWSRVVSRECWHVYAVIGCYGLPRDVADDIVQDVLLAASRKIEEFSHNGRTGAFRAWLNAIVTSKLADKGRELKKQLESKMHGGDFVAFVEGLTTGHSTDAVDAQRRWLAEEIMEAARSTSTPIQWEVFCRVVFEEHRPQDVAADLGVSVNQVYLIKSRTLRRLTTLFNSKTE